MTLGVSFGTGRLLVSTICDQRIIPIDDTMAEDLIASCCTEANNSVADECQMNPDVDERGKWQLYHVRRLAFHFTVVISFYFMQHTPLWRSKFRIKIKKTRTKIGTLRISHKFKLHRDIWSGSFTKTNLRKTENRSHYWHGLVTE